MPPCRWALCVYNGQTAATADNLTGFIPNEWTWSEVTMDGSVATLDLNSSGVYMLDLFMREDGLRVDKMLLITDTNFIPSGSGPAESVFETITTTIPAQAIVQYMAMDYDPLYRLTEAEYSGAYAATYGYEYNALGNRTRYTTTITAAEVITYQYDLANRLVESLEVGGETTAYIWDDAGRLITTTVGATVSRVYSYSQDGDMTAALVDNLLTTFVYDGGGNRLQLSVAGEVTTYTLDYAAGSRLLFEEGGAFSDTKHYLYGLACIAEEVDAEEPETEAWRYYQRDGNSMVRQTTDEQSEVTLAWTYSPEGAVLVGEEGPVTNLDCDTNAIYDWSTGLIFKNGGYFDPSTGIWITLSGMVIYHTWAPQHHKRGNSRTKNRKWPWFCLHLLFISLLLSGCGGSGSGINPVARGSTPTPCPDIATPTPRPTDDPNAPLSPPILPTQLTPPAQSTPRGNYQSQYDAAYEEEVVALLNGHIVLVNNAWFASNSPATPIKWETGWIGARLEMLGALNAYTGSHGFGSPTKFIDEMVLSQQNPLRLFRSSALGAGGTYTSGGGIPRIMVPEYGVTATTLVHELAHRWDDAHNFTLSGNMATQIANGTIEGPAPTQYGAGSGKEDFADSVMAYFIVSGAISGSSLIENPNWSDNDPLNQLGPNRTSASPNTVYTKDRYDYIEPLFR